MRLSTSLLFFIIAIFLFSCRPGIDKEQERQNILILIQQIQEAHFKKDAVQFYAANAEQWYDVRNGRVQIKEKKASIQKTQGYLDIMEFISIENTHPPVVEISDDGSLASYIGAIIVQGKLQKAPVFWVVSWQSVLKKIDNEWKIISTANTEAPDEEASLILEKVAKATGDLPANTTVYALADCNGPIGDFKTLLFSDTHNGRMEQHTKSRHSILKHGKEHSWGINVSTGKKQDSISDLMAEFIKGHEFHQLSLRPQDRFHSPVFKGFTTYANQTAFKVVFKDALDRTVNFYYSWETYTPLGMEAPTDTEENKVKVSFSNWKDIDGIKFFNKVVIEEGDVTWTYKYTDIRLNTLKPTDFEDKTARISL